MIIGTTDRCMKGLANDIFQHKIDTDHMSIERVAETIASQSNIELLPNNRNKLKKKLDRIKTQLKHIRFIN
ncbi:hypothetical protein [Gracilibacillus lacisalsi]|uniref:hypothetical protein n=1 Tax=Gracilibacillus lacisalsi TaxID=393087 RepID=UPI00035D2A14|nr:hypothetical protein [Gracilibacillus lacisalsi]